MLSFGTMPHRAEINGFNKRKIGIGKFTKAVSEAVKTDFK
jgi:hypothetical protein